MAEAETVDNSRSLPPLTESAYAEAYRHFLGALIRPDGGPWLPYLTRTLPSLCLPPSDRPEPVRILSIGAGAGADDLWLIKNVFLPHSKNLHYDAIEPNADHFEEFKKNAAMEEENNISGLHLHNVAFEDFPPPSAAAEKYDLVLLIHSLYYLAPTALKLIYDEYIPANSGSIVVILNSPCGLPRLQKTLGVEGAHDLHLEDALDGLEGAKKEIIYTMLWMDLEEAFANTTQDLHLLEFIVVRDLTHAAPELLDNIRKELQDRALVRKGRRMYWIPEGVGIVQK
ncbi:unnamed protein product [Calypogeia fissa]